MWQINDYAIWGSFLESNLTQKKGTEVNRTQQLSLFSLELGSNMLKMRAQVSRSQGQSSWPQKDVADP